MCRNTDFYADIHINRNADIYSDIHINHNTDIYGDVIADLYSHGNIFTDAVIYADIYRKPDSRSVAERVTFKFANKDGYGHADLHHDNVLYFNHHADCVRHTDNYFQLYGNSADGYINYDHNHDMHFYTEEYGDSDSHADFNLHKYAGKYIHAGRDGNHDRSVIKRDGYTNNATYGNPDRYINGGVDTADGYTLGNCGTGN
jgi:hypothetical protein